MKFQLLSWKPLGRETLIGFADVEFDDSYVVRGVRVMAGKNGLWAAMPATSWTDRQGKVRYNPIFEFSDKADSVDFSEALVRLLRSRYGAELGVELVS